MSLSDPGLYNSISVRSFTELTAKRYPHVDLDKVIKGAGMDPCEIADPGHWFTQECVDRFVATLQEETGNPEIAREAGQYVASPDFMGGPKQWAMSFLGPATTFKIINQAAGKISKASDYTSRPISQNKVEVIATPKEGTQEKSYQCLNRIGFWESIVALFGYKLTGLEHPECIFKGGHACRYIISWEIPSSAYWRRARNIFGAATLLMGPVSGVFWPATSPILIPTLLLSFFGLWIISLEKERDEFKTNLEKMRDPAAKLMDQIEANYNAARITHEVGEALTDLTDETVIIERVNAILEKRLDFDRGAVFLADDQRQTLVFHNGYGFTAAQMEIIRENPFPIKELSSDIFSKTFCEQKPQLVENVQDLGGVLTPRGREIATLLEAKSFICSPIVSDKESIGVLIVEETQGLRPLVKSDVSLMMGIAPVLGITIGNARLMKTQTEQRNVILALERAKDEITVAKERSEKYAEELQVINEELKSFTYIVSHDLRAPLVNIRGFSAELATCVDELKSLIAPLAASMSEAEKKASNLLTEEDIPEALEYISSSVTRMDALINNILNLSRAGRRELNWELVECRPIVENILKTLTHQIEAKQGVVDIGELPAVTSDKVSVEQIFGNLLDNAIKYMENGRPARIWVSAHSTPDEVVFQVRDNGRGIDQKDMEKIWAIFRRVGRQDTQGEGMGLAYVRTLVRRLGGRIWCKSTVGKGTEFFFSLPLHHDNPRLSLNADC